MLDVFVESMPRNAGMLRSRPNTVQCLSLTAKHRAAYRATAVVTAADAPPGSFSYGMIMITTLLTSGYVRLIACVTTGSI